MSSNSSVSSSAVSWRETGLLALVLFAFWFALCGLRPLSVPDEGRYPEIAREMLSCGDYVTPHLNGVVFLDKPILYYWLQTASYRVLGVNNWSVRLMPVLFGVFGAVLVFIASWKIFNRRAAWLAVAALVCNPLYFGATQYANMDLEVAIWVTATLLLFLMGREATTGSMQRRWLFWAAYAAMGCGVLTKGLIGAVFPLMVIGVWVILGWRWRELLRWQIVSGVVVTLLVCLPWYLAVQKANPKFFHYFFIYQQFERFSSGGFNNALPFWFYAAVLMAGLLPWSLWLPKALFNQWRCAYGMDAIANADSRQLLLLWAVLIFIFFSIPQSKIVGYILPVVPPLAILLGEYLDRKLTLAGNTPSFFLKHNQSLAVVGFVCSLALVLAIPRFEKDTIPDLVQQLKSLRQPGDLVINYHNYNQDLPMLLQQREPIMIVEDWDDAAVMHEDNWHHDLSYGLNVDPSVRQWLIDDAQFSDTLKSASHVYVITNHHYEDRLISQYHFSVVARSGKNLLLMSTQERSGMTSKSP